MKGTQGGRSSLPRMWGGSSARGESTVGPRRTAVAAALQWSPMRPALRAPEMPRGRSGRSRPRRATPTPRPRFACHDCSAS